MSTVHYLQYGHTACLKPGAPKDWDQDHKWSGDWADVTCADCLKGREPIETFTISEDGKTITCKRCRKTSHHPEDVKNHYCGFCHVWHDDIWPPARRWWLDHPEPEESRTPREASLSRLLRDLKKPEKP